MGQCGSQLGDVGPYGVMWVPYGAMWVPMGQCGSYWAMWVPYGAMWVPYGAMWVPMGRCGSLWGSVGALWGDGGPYGESLQGDVGLMGQWESLWVPMGVPMGPYGALWVAVWPYGAAQHPPVVGQPWACGAAPAPAAAHVPHSERLPSRTAPQRLHGAMHPACPIDPSPIDPRLIDPTACPIDPSPRDPTAP